MDIKDALLHRMSCPALTEPGPDDEQLKFIFQAALRAPDHARLRPWRFLTISGESRRALGEHLVAVTLADQPELSADVCERLRGLPLRAPCLIALICKKQAHDKVPEIEQQLSLGAAAQNILHAAHALNLGAIWRTGAVTYHPLLAEKMGLAENEVLLGFIYLGTPVKTRKKLPELALDDFVTPWHG